LKATLISSLVSAFLAVRGLVGKLIDTFSGLIDWLGTFCTETSKLSSVIIPFVGAILDTIDLISNMVILGLSISRLIQLGEFHA
jgi:hypothetical protein